MTALWLIPVVALAAAALTGAFRQYALTYGLIDVPLARSSHTIPTPRGGGLAIVIAFLAAVIALAWMGQLNRDVAVAIVGAGVAVALVGFADDHGSIAVHWRLVVHLAAASWVLYWLGGAPPLDLADHLIDLGWAGHVLWAIGMAWLLNLYNFMDGIDGLAGCEAVTVCAGATLLYVLIGLPPTEWMLPALLGAAALGFLVWNWPPARIFMGDGGSGFVGLILGVLTLRAAQQRPALLWVWMILLAVFVTDATLTLLVRLWKGENLREAHRGHVYQHASQALKAHLPVTVAAGLINLAWLLPVAGFVTAGGISPIVGAIVAYLPLVWLAMRWRS